MSPRSSMPPRTRPVAAGLPASRAASASPRGPDGRGGVPRASVGMGRVNVGRASGVTVPGRAGVGVSPPSTRGGFTLSALVRDF